MIFLLPSPLLGNGFVTEWFVVELFDCFDEIGVNFDGDCAGVFGVVFGALALGASAGLEGEAGRLVPVGTGCGALFSESSTTFVVSRGSSTFFVTEVPTALASFSTTSTSLACSLVAAAFFWLPKKLAMLFLLSALSTGMMNVGFRGSLATADHTALHFLLRSHCRPFQHLC